MKRQAQSDERVGATIVIGATLVEAEAWLSSWDNVSGGHEVVGVWSHRGQNLKARVSKRMLEDHEAYWVAEVTGAKVYVDRLPGRRITDNEVPTEADHLLPSERGEEIGPVHRPSIWDN